MLSKILSTIAISLFLVGCGTKIDQAVITKNVYVVVEPPENIRDCPPAPNTPEASTLKNKDVINYINRLRESHARCRISMKAIEEFIAASKKNVDSLNQQ